MAIAFVFQSATLQESEYDTIMAALDANQGGATGAPGFIAHLGGASPSGGWQVIDVWESGDAANAFYSSDAFAPVREGTADAGLSMTPWPLHRIDVVGAFSQRT